MPIPFTHTKSSCTKAQIVKYNTVVLLGLYDLKNNNNNNNLSGIIQNHKP